MAAKISFLVGKVPESASPNDAVNEYQKFLTFGLHSLVSF